MKYEVLHKIKTFTENAELLPDGFSKVTFINRGEDDCTIMNEIPLKAGSPDFTIEEQPYCVIRTKFVIAFDNVKTSKRVIVLLTYSQKIE